MSEELNMKFTSEDELDDVLKAIGETAEVEDSKASVLNQKRFEQMDFAHAVLQFLTRDMSGVTVTYKLHDPYTSMGHIDVEGKSLEFYNSELFARAAEFANNMEVYPKTNGKVHISLMFYGLTNPIE